jgi:hypothetical protein
VQFALPGGAAPQTSIGGGSRGEIQFTAAPDRGAPGSSVGAGSRGEIPAALTALVPPSKYGRTVSARPTLYVYLPPIGAEEVFFSLQDEDGNPYYHSILQVPSNGGVIPVALPPTAPALEMDKNYLWYFAPIEPGGILQPDNYAVTGWVRRVRDEVNEREFSASPVELATRYAEAGIWYDMLEVLVLAKSSEPDNKNFATEWHDLLEQVGLEAISAQPLLKN